MKKTDGRLYMIRCLSIVWLLTSWGCAGVPPSEPIEPSDLYGAYVANFDAGIADTLLILKDHTYKRTFVTKDSTQYVDTGTWEFEVYEPTYYILNLTNFVYRFTTHEADYDRIYSEKVGAKLDSTPKSFPCSVWKDTYVNRWVVRLGFRWGHAWVRELPIVPNN